jgi:hypothetical protein
MSYSKCLGMGDPITSPSQVPSDLDLMWLKLDGQSYYDGQPVASNTDGPLTITPVPDHTDSWQTTVSKLLPLGVAGAVAYFLIRNK